MSINFLIFFLNIYTSTNIFDIMKYVKDCFREVIFLNTQFISEISDKCRLEAEALFSEKCSFKVGGRIGLCIFPSDSKALICAVRSAEKYGEKYAVLGNMTNILPPDEMYNGTVIATSEMQNICFDGNTVFAEAGVSLTKLAISAAKRGLSGLEFAYGIPGSIGGAVYMNAGAYGGCMADVLTSVTAIDPGTGIVSDYASGECRFGYRESRFRHSGEVIVSARIELRRGNTDEIISECEKNMAARREKQPLDKPSAGSTFRRPEGHYAGALIEASGLKGMSFGGAQVSEKHAGFVINAGNASSSDISEIIKLIKNKVYMDSGIMLEEEIIYIK